ncbi:MAG: peptide-methionine (S)-S-oxide reductase [Psychroserpens sp.]|jgi:peptide-methionine (S)-S-oxide reductase
MENLVKIGFGGGCHWCTEAVFQSLKGVEKVDQGWIASEGKAIAFSEAVIVHFDASQIPLPVLVEVHLRTHKSTSEHSMRNKYRSAIYYFNTEQKLILRDLLNEFQPKFDNPLITKVLPYQKFKTSGIDLENYYFKNPKKPFCTSYIDPKLNLLKSTFSTYTDKEKLKHLNPN